MPGFADLQPDDMRRTLKALKPVTVFGPPAQKQTKVQGEESVVEIKERELVESQNEQICKYKEELRKVEKDDLVKILEYNGQKVPNGQERVSLSC